MPPLDSLIAGVVVLVLAAFAFRAEWRESSEGGGVLGGFRKRTRA